MYEYGTVARYPRNDSKTKIMRPFDCDAYTGPKKQIVYRYIYKMLKCNLDTKYTILAINVMSRDALAVCQLQHKL